MPIPLTTWITGGVAALAIAAAGVQTVRLAGEKQDFADARAEWNAGKLKQTEQLAAANAENRRFEQRRQSMVMEATNARTKREETLRRDAAGVRTELAGLRNDLTRSAANLPGASCDAVRKRVSAAENVFEQCAGRYSGLAETAGRHASDSLMYQQAWPR